MKKLFHAAVIVSLLFTAAGFTVSMVYPEKLFTGLAVFFSGLMFLFVALAIDAYLQPAPTAYTRKVRQRAIHHSYRVIVLSLVMIIVATLCELYLT